MKLHFSLRTKLTLWYAVVLTATLSLFGTAAYFYTKETLSESLDVSLRSQVGWLRQYLQQRAEIKKKKKKSSPKQTLPPKNIAAKKDTVKTSPYLFEWTEADSIWYEIYEQAMRNPKKTFLFVKNNKGLVFYRSENLEPDDSLFIPRDTTTFGDAVLTTYQTKDGEERRLAYAKDNNGEVWVAYPMQEIETILDNLFSNLIFISPIAILFSLIGGWFIAKKSLRPIDEVIETAKKISVSNLDQQIPHHSVDDEIGRLVATFNEMIVRLRNSFELTRQFTMDASHELRTPLTIMRGEIEVALHNENLEEEQREILLSLLEETIRMNSIIEGLLLLSKSDLNMYKPSWEEVRLSELTAELFEDGEFLAQTKHISIVLEQNDEICLFGDKVRLRQLFLNLLDNAIKYTPENGKVILALYRLDGLAVFKIEDTGIGIPQHELHKIFNRFYRVDKARSREMGGTGLGLSIAKWIVEMHGGKILVHSEVNAGTTFVIKFPLDNNAAIHSAINNP